MNDYCSDNQLESINGWVCKISEDLDEIKKPLNFNQNKIVFLPKINTVDYRGVKIDSVEGLIYYEEMTDDIESRSD